MSTIIRHKLTNDGFAVVVTYWDSSKRFTATVQRYREHATGGGLSLEFSSPWNCEPDAIAEWQKIPDLTFDDCGHCGHSREDDAALCPWCLEYN